MRTLARTDSRGAVAAGAVVFEAALVTPLLVLIMLGIVEMALLMRDNVALSSLVRDGGRAAVASMDQTAGQSPDVAGLATAAIAQARSTISKDSISEVWVYRADSAGFPMANSSGDHFDRCEAGCMAYEWDAHDKVFRAAGGDLDVADLSSCTSDFGVYLKAKHSFLTGLFRGVSISKHETFRVDGGAGCQVAAS